jgi:non-lysosomal glucosylceramidase
VEYFGPNPQMTGWYLGALRAAEEMARHLGEEDFARRCHELFERGSRWMDENLFNGEYYEHHVVPITDEKKIAPGLMVGMGAKNLADPDFQLGAGCLVDQLVGQFTAHVCGLGYLHAPERVKAALQSVYKYNFKESLAGHFNHLRSFVLNDEPAFLMCSYPKGREPKNPFPYCNEVMTGFEYTAAVGLLYEGATKQGLRGISAVRSRYDGWRRNPFNEAECGHHYARAMASWAAVLAWTGFQYSAVTGVLTFADRAGTWFWSTGYAWGTCRIARAGSKRTVEIDVLHGELKVSRLTLSGYGEVSLRGGKMIAAGKMLALKLESRAKA